jgi:NitT/TauT family transport system ATP-binding protein
MSMLELKGAAKSRGGKPVVASATLRLGPGELLCLSGPSGIGKSTLLEMMAGILSPDAGSVRREVPASLAFQDDALIPWLTAEANIRYILPRELPPEKAARRAAFWLPRFGLQAGEYPSAMSGGMRRRLSLARAFAAGRKLLFLDEPFAFLDESWQKAVAEEIAAQVEAGAGIVLASHSTEPFSLSCLARLPCRFFTLTETPVVLRG